jgi:hypothetical protein
MWFERIRDYATQCLARRMPASPEFQVYTGWRLSGGECRSGSLEAPRSVCVIGNYQPNEFCLLRILQPGITFVDARANVFALHRAARLLQRFRPAQLLNSPTVRAATRVAPADRSGSFSSRKATASTVEMSTWAGRCTRRTRPHSDSENLVAIPDSYEAPWGSPFLSKGQPWRTTKGSG